MMKKFVALFTAISILLSMSDICGMGTVYADNISLYAKSAVLMDADSGRVLYERNGYEQMAMASTTKIMTLIVTLENANLEDTVTVSAYAASMPDVQLNIREGETYRLNDLVYSLMLESHNDSAVAIAEHVGGSVEGFAALMNEKADEIGCENTYYITPNGLDATNGDKFHSTTARDLALVMSYCIKKSPQKETFLTITRTPSHSFSDLSGKRSFSCTNHNAFLSMMTGALSGKTGFTNKAGYCYVGALERDGKTFVVALLACGWPNHKTYKWSDTRTLMEFGITNYNYRSFDEVQIPQRAYEEVLITGAKSDRINGMEAVKVELVDAPEGSRGIDGLLMSDEEKITITLHKVKELSAPVSEGQKVGHISYMVGDEEWKRVDIVTTQEKEAIDFRWCFKMIFDKWSI
ncbi:MAG: D-alanyl-D-alanine carboxypeptidase [Lachnospiraceae bacterium]|nr:D-alanyl-D-alanine carboxypeptidase [Lachnospiraceae bacterium]